jgi:hypothetical protein
VVSLIAFLVTIMWLLMAVGLLYGVLSSMNDIPKPTIERVQ